MNIFYLDHDPFKAAEYHSDRHCCKAILESCQILSTAHHLSGFDNHPLLCKATHIHHPCIKWASASLENYRWLADLGIALCLQYFERYQKVHAWQERLEWLSQNEPSLPESKFIQPPQCVAEECKDRSCVTAYRRYYREVKANKMKLTWKNKVPTWFLEDSNNG